MATVYIVIRDYEYGEIIIESAWSTLDLATEEADRLNKKRRVDLSRFFVVDEYDIHTEPRKP